MSDIHPSTAPSICRNRSCMRPFKSSGRAVHRRSTDLLKPNKLNPTRALCLPHQLLSNGRAEKHGAAEAQQDVLRTGRAEKHARPYGLRRGDELTAAMLLLSSTVALNDQASCSPPSQQVVKRWPVCTPVPRSLFDMFMRSRGYVTVRGPRVLECCIVTSL
jgi:hypothetical protein